MKIFLLILVLSVGSVSVASGQEIDTPLPPKPRVLSQVTAPSCEYVMTNLYAAGIELQNNPSATLYALIHPAKGKPAQARYQAAAIYGWANGQRFDLTRITIALGLEREKQSVEFIIVPIGAEAPAVESVWSRTSPFDAAGTLRKATLIATETIDEDPCAYNPGYQQDLAAYLKSNPAVTAKIVIKTESRSAFDRDAVTIRQELTQKYGIPVQRFRIVYKRSAQWPKAPFSETEYWLLPAHAGTK